MTTRPDAMKLLIRADDFGMCHAINTGVLKAWRRGILTTTSVMAPCPWFWEAARLCRENPTLDVGVHLTLFCEWRDYRWRPISPAGATRGFTDSSGCFFPHPQALLRARPDWRRVEAEFRRQVDMVVGQGISPSHASLHWTRPGPIPQALYRVLKGLSRKYDFPVSGSLGEARVPLDFLNPALGDTQRQAVLLRDLRPGLNLAIVHPADGSPEMRGLTLRWRSPYRVAHRFAELAGLLRRGARRELRAAGVELTGYRGLMREA